MAIIHENYNELNDQVKKNRLVILSAWLITFVFLSFIPDSLLFISFFPAIFITIFQIKKNHILKIGIKGENNALKAMQALDNDFHVINNIKVNYEGKESELDFVLVGKTGIYVVEVKNHNGTIQGDEADQKWKQHKIGQKGGEYTNSFYNPTKQVGTHVYRLSKYLKKNGISHWVQGMVMFINPSANVEVSTKNIPVFKNDNELIAYMGNSDHTLKEKEIEKIIALLN